MHTDLEPTQENKPPNLGHRLTCRVGSEVLSEVLKNLQADDECRLPTTMRHDSSTYQVNVFWPGSPTDDEPSSGFVEVIKVPEDGLAKIEPGRLACNVYWQQTETESDSYLTLMPSIEGA